MSLTTITRSKPFYVVAGATDVAVKTLREVPGKLATVKVERADLEKAVATLQAEAVALPGKAVALQDKAQTVALGLAGEVAGKADAVYGDLLTRGRSVVGRIRRQKSTQDLKKHAATTVRRTKATTTTAKKQASATRTSAKSASTAARKTASAAAKATADGAGKLGS